MTALGICGVAALLTAGCAEQQLAEPGVGAGPATALASRAPAQAFGVPHKTSPAASAVSANAQAVQDSEPPGLIDGLNGGSVEPAARAEASGWPELTPPDIPRNFCTERVHTLDADACFALPESSSDELLIYLHGIIPPSRDSPQKTNFENVVANSSERAGVVALIPRGKVGFAPKKHESWWGWPTGRGSYALHGDSFIAKIRGKRDKLEETLGLRFKTVYLAGSSSGAYFVAAVALHGGMPEVDGFGVLSGGAGYPTDALSELTPKPVYVGFGNYDSVARTARALGALLDKAGWPLRVAVHPVSHGAREVYLDEAFAFWRGVAMN